MSDKLKCRDCIWLDTKNKHKSGLCECLNTNIKHTRLGHLRYPTSLACVKGFEGFDGQTIGCATKRTYEQGYADAIDEFASKLLCLASNKCKFINTKEYTYYVLEQEEIDNLIYMLAKQLKEQRE